MRCLLGLLLLTACTESRVIEDFDSGPVREDAAGLDAPAFDVSRFDVSRADVPPRRDAGARDAGPVRVDTGPVLDAGLDVAPSLDILMECTQLCERYVMCDGGGSLRDCIPGCLDIEEFALGPVCERLAYNLFRCGERVPCEDLEFAFETGICREDFNVFTSNCGDL